MTTTDIDLIDPFEEYATDMERVVNEYLKGELNPTKIAQTTGLKRAVVVGYIQSWKDIAQNDKGIKARGREALTEMDRHYSLIIKELWGIVNDPSVTLVVKNGALKNIADVEAKRQATLQQAGLYADSGVADEIVAMEEQAEAIKELLTKVTSKYPETTAFILEGLQRIFGEGTAMESDPT